MGILLRGYHGLNGDIYIYGIYIYTHYKGNVTIRMNQHIRVTASDVVSCGI